MPTYHFIPEEETVNFKDRLTQRLNSCSQAIIASAFFTFGAFHVIKPPLLNALGEGAKIIFLLGRFDYVTEPKAVKGLLKIAEKFPEQLKIYFDADYSFHFKIAIFKSNNKEIVIIGSSNLTPKGMSSVGEVNLEIVENKSVFEQSQELLTNRISKAEKAEDTIDEYTKKYKSAKKYRQQRQRWNNKGKKTWIPKKHKPITFSEPVGKEFVFCWISDKEDDEKLMRNIENRRKSVQSTSMSFPNQWTHVPNNFGQQINEGDCFFICDDIGFKFGFAICTKKFKVLNKNDKQATAIFYRYGNGWKSQFKKSTDDYQNTLKTLKIKDDSETLKGVLLEKTISHFRSVRKKSSK